jgi:translocation and assembly module TamB
MARTGSRYSRKPRHDWGRLFARFFCLIFGIIGAVPLGVGLLVRTSVVRNWAARETAAVLQRELGVSAHYGVEVRAWPLSFALSNVVVDASDALGAALEVGRIAVRPRLFALLGGRVDAGHIEIDAPRVRLVVRDGAVQNLRYRLPKTSDRPPSRHAPFTSLAVTDAALDVEIDGVRIRGRDVDIDVDTEDGPRFEVVLKAGQQSIVRDRTVLSMDPAAKPRMARDVDVLCQLDARLRIGAGSLLVQRLSLTGFVDLDGEPGTGPNCDSSPQDPRRV